MQAVDYYRSLSDAELAEVDLGELNLVCASNLPGAEELDIEQCSAWIDEMVRKVKLAIEANVDEFSRNPGEFNNSMAVFYMAMLCEVMTREPRVRYNPERKKEPENKSNSQDQFIHDIINGDGGTCASLPVLYAAVGRRLGFPLKLVNGTRHLFLRWEDFGQTPLARDRFNIEATTPGLCIYPDEHYLRWPFRPPGDIDPSEFLRSLTPRDELGMFLAMRAYCLLDNGKYWQAIEPITWARQLASACDLEVFKIWQEATILLALGVFRGCPPPPPATEEHVVCDDGRVIKKRWWPRPCENPDYLPAAKLPPALLSRLLPNAGPDLSIGELAEPLEQRLGHYADDELVENILTTAKTEAMIADVMRMNAANRAKRERMMQPMPQPRPPAFPGMPQPGRPHSPHQVIPPGVQQPGRPQIPAAFDPAMPGRQAYVPPSHASPAIPEDMEELLPAPRQLPRLPGGPI